MINILYYIDMYFNIQKLTLFKQNLIDYYAYQFQNNNNAQHYKMAQLPIISAHYAQQKLENLYKHIPSTLNFLQNFYKHQDIKYLSLPQPTYAFKQQKPSGRNGSIEKQLQYLRGKQPSDWHYDCISDILEDERQNWTGFLNRKRNCGIFIENKLYYAVNNRVFMIQIELNEQSHKINSKKPKDIIQLKWQILEIFLCKKNKQQLCIRTRNTIFKINLSNSTAETAFDSDVQISGSTQNYWKNQIDVCQYYHNTNKISSISLKGSQTILQTKDIINSFWRYTPSELLILKPFQISIFDIRQNKYSPLKKNAPKSQRFYSSIPLRDQHQILPFFAVCDSNYISIFDIRKSSQTVLKYRHCNQEAPPVVLQYITYQKIKLSGYNLINEILNKKQTYQQFNPTKLLLAHSPYPYGSSTYKILNLQQQINSFKQQSLQCLEHDHQFMNLLYDTGKLFKNVHPSSISMTFFEEKLLFFHIDNLGGVSLQCFTKNASDQFQHELISQKPQQQRSSIVNYLFPGDLRFRDKQLDPGFRKFIIDQTYKYKERKITQQSQCDWLMDLQEVEDQHPSVSYYNLKSFAKKLHEMALQKNIQKQLPMTMSQQHYPLQEQSKKFESYQITINQMKNLILRGQISQKTAFESQNILSSWSQQQEN